MSPSRSDKPTTRKSRSATVAETTRSAADVTDARYVWSGKVFPVFSIPNIEAEPWYIRLDVSMLGRDDYILYVETGALFPTEMPFQIFPPNFVSGETPEEGNPLILSSRFEFGDDPPGNMIQIPPHSQVNITMRLRKDCHVRQDFRVMVYRHFGRTRDSDFRKDMPLAREFFQIPEADTCALDVEVLTRDAHFRPWNLAARRSHFFWNLAFFGRPLFNRPQFLVQAQNLGSLPVNVQAHLYKVTGQEKKAFGLPAPEETLAPGQECVWTFPLWLRDPKEADEAVFASTVEVKNSGHKLKDIDAGDKVIPEYHPYRSLPKDLLALFCILGLIGGTLCWATLGIPVWVTPQVGVHFQFEGQNDGDLPQGLIGDFKIAELDENGNQIVINGVKNYSFQTPYATAATGRTGNEKVYYCLLPTRLMGYRWPFGWGMLSSRERSYMINIEPNGNFERSGKYVFNKDDLKITESPTLKFHLPLKIEAKRIHDFSVGLKANKHLMVTANLTGPAADTNDVNFTLYVETNGETSEQSRKSHYFKGKTTVVNFDVTSYVAAGKPINIAIVAKTDKNYKSELAETGVSPKELCTTRTMKEFTLDGPPPATSASPGSTQPSHINQSGVSAIPGAGTKKSVDSGGSKTSNIKQAGGTANQGTATNQSEHSSSTDSGQTNTPGQLPPSTSGDNQSENSNNTTSLPDAPDAKGGQTSLSSPKGDIHLPPTGTESSGTVGTERQPRLIPPSSAISPGTPAGVSDTKLNSFSADELLALDMTAQAEAKADAMLQTNLPDQQAAAHAVKGMIYLRNDKVPEAKYEIDQAMNTPGSPPTGRGRALAFLARARLDKMNDALNQEKILDDFTSATKADPKLVLAWADKARYWFESENKRQAEKAYASGKKYNLNSALFHYCFTLVFHDGGELDKAQAQKQLMLQAEGNSNRKRVMKSSLGEVGL